MKKSLFVAAFAALAVVACKKTEVVDTTNDMDSSAMMEVPADTMNMNMADSASMMADSAAVVTEKAAEVAEEAAGK